MLRKNRTPQPATTELTKQVSQWLDTIKHTTREARGMLDIPEEKSLDFCIRPNRQLREVKDELIKRYGRSVVDQTMIPHTHPMLNYNSDTIALYWASAHFLEHRSHRLTLHNDERVAYHREPFAVDCQALGSRTLNLHGIEAIAEEPTAIQELEVLATTLESATFEKNTGRIAIVSC